MLAKSSRILAEQKVTTPRVGGRLHQTPLGSHEKHPLLLPKGHQVLTMILSYVNDQEDHQGRKMAHGDL